MALPLEPADVFAALRASVDVALGTLGRREVSVQEVPAPRRLAPHALALSAEVTRDGHEVASGRFVVLHDPQGQEGWLGTTRVVAFASADVEPDMGADPALAAVGWQWLEEALDAHGAVRVAAGGTVTRTTSTRFGELDLREEPLGPHDTAATSAAHLPEEHQLEIRASWTALEGPDGTLDLGAHLRGWADLLATTAGLPPAGVTPLRAR